jgi:hypothetical protein
MPENTQHPCQAKPVTPSVRGQAGAAKRPLRRLGKARKKATARLKVTYYDCRANPKKEPASPHTSDTLVNCRRHRLLTLSFTLPAARVLVPAECSQHTNLHLQRNLDNCYHCLFL